MNRLRTAMFVLGALVVSSATSLAGSSKELYLNTVKATCMILTPNGGGTGWVVNKDKKQIITAAHVVERREKVGVVFPTFVDNKPVTDRSKYSRSEGTPGRVIKSDRTRDLALIEVDELPAGTTELKMADAVPDTGDDVHSVGCPGASTGLWVYSYGRVRQVTEFDAREGKVAAKATNVQVVESQVPINPGDSGGPLLNDKGEVVGVNRSVHMGSALISISVAMTEVKSFLAEPMPDKKADGKKGSKGDDDDGEIKPKSKGKSDDDSKPKGKGGIDKDDLEGRHSLRKSAGKE